LLLFLYVTKEAGRKYVRDMPWPPAAECNMITNKQTQTPVTIGLARTISIIHFVGNRCYCNIEGRTICAYSMIQREERKDSGYIKNLRVIFGYAGATLCNSLPDVQQVGAGVTIDFIQFLN